MTKYETGPETMARILGYAADVIDELAGDLEAELVQRYNPRDEGVHPALQSRYERDMEPIERGGQMADALRGMIALLRERGTR